MRARKIEASEASAVCLSLGHNHEHARGQLGLARVTYSDSRKVYIEVFAGECRIARFELDSLPVEASSSRILGGAR